jgi:cellulose biosynthesis protein BcsQ
MARNEDSDAADGALHVTHRMFSAASFAGVIAEEASGELQDAEVLPAGSPIVVAFYGFRGGAGRTTALAHVAALLASRQIQVVAIDLDLEAPGLHHVLACPPPEPNRGALALLREATASDEDDKPHTIHLAPHILKSTVAIGAPIRVLPAGRLSDGYFERLEDLGVPLWHLIEGPSPLEAIIEQVQIELAPQVICLDCRTGLSGLSASAMFHVADVVVSFLPVSEQSLDGLEPFFRAAKAAKLRRQGRPELLLVPSMVPEGPDGRKRLDEWFIPEVETRYAEFVLGAAASEDADTIWEQIPIVREGIEYRRGIALADHLRNDFVQRASGVYQPLMERLEPLLGLDQQAGPTAVDAKKVLHDLDQLVDLKSLAFAESTPSAEIVRKFIRPTDFKAIVDRATWYVVGAKGAGKTWLWTYLLSDVGGQTTPDNVYVAAHGPGTELLSASALRELERDKTIQMNKRQVYGALWLLYAAKRILGRYPDLAEPISERFSGDERRLLRKLINATSATFQKELSQILAFERVSTFAEHLLRGLDALLLNTGLTAATLLYDGLDVGFGSDEKSLLLRRRYVAGLVEALEPIRGLLRRIFFKVFLREDIFTELNVQNQSHLAAATAELRWEPRDLWLLALNIVAESPHYRDVLRSLDPSVGPDNWPSEDERREALLVPLWGQQMERGNKTSTARWVQRRTADGKARLFPRTLVQLLASAVGHQRTIEAFPDRVLRSAAIVEGYNDASARRVEDLRKEYAFLSVYLDSLQGMKPTGTEEDFLTVFQSKMRRRNTKKKGVAAGSLHAGPGGWHKVIEKLLEIGVLREYRRARGNQGEQKYEIALLYRPGLGIKTYGA